MEERVSRGEERNGGGGLPSGINCVSKNVNVMLKRGIKDTKRKFKEKRGLVKLLHKHPS